MNDRNNVLGYAFIKISNQLKNKDARVFLKKKMNDTPCARPARVSRLTVRTCPTLLLGLEVQGSWLKCGLQGFGNLLLGHLLTVNHLGQVNWIN